MEKLRWHYTARKLYDTGHPITIALIGLGGTGSNILPMLARMNHALVSIGFEGIHVTSYDGSEIRPPNIGRQIFLENNIGRPKASTITSMVNRSYALNWKAYDVKTTLESAKANIIISCIDDWEARLKFHEEFREFAKKKNLMDYETPYYWLDTGNETSYGQIILGSMNIPQPQGTDDIEPIKRLKTVVEVARLETPKKEASNPGPSCSLAEALERQDLLINNFIALHAVDMLWQLIRRQVIDYNALFFNNSLKFLTSKIYDTNRPNYNDAGHNGSDQVRKDGKLRKAAQSKNANRSGKRKR